MVSVNSRSVSNFLTSQASLVPEIASASIYAARNCPGLCEWKWFVHGVCALPSFLVKILLLKNNLQTAEIWLLMLSDRCALNSNWFMNPFPVCTLTWLTWELAKKHEPIHMLIQIAGATGRNITTWGQQMWDMMWTTGPKGWYVCAMFVPQKSSHAKLSKAPTWTAMPSVGVLRSLACKLGDIEPSAIVMLLSGLLYFTVCSCVFLFI